MICTPKSRHGYSFLLLESVLKISGANLDMGYMEKWAKKLGITDDLEKLGL